jgi:uncharacterized OsmC-like protein
MSNRNVGESLKRAKRLFRERPSAAIKSMSANAVWRNGLACEISGQEGQKVVTDMAKPLGGGDNGPSPGWLLRASLASCTATAIAMRAAMRGIELRKLEVVVHADTDVRGAVGIDGTSLALGGTRMTVIVGSVDAAADEQLREIAEWAASHSTVAATLREGRTVALEVTVT